LADSTRTSHADAHCVFYGKPGPGLRAHSTDDTRCCCCETHRLSVRLNSKYFSEDKSFLYLVEFDVQQRVTDRDSGKMLFATLAKWYSWGIVPSESELHKNIAQLITSKVNTWTPE